jgi:hypothetical protein
VRPARPSRGRILWPSRFVHMTAGVALPLALAGPAVYLVGLLLAK